MNMVSKGFNFHELRGRKGFRNLLFLLYSVSIESPSQVTSRQLCFDPTGIPICIGIPYIS